MVGASNVDQIVADSVASLGYEFVGIEHANESGKLVLRIFIDIVSGISASDCQLVSKHVDAALAVDAPSLNDYNLEVSSPGLERRLFTIEQFRPFIGKQVLLKLHKGQYERRKLQGALLACDDDSVTVEVAGESFSVPFLVIKKANLVASFE